MDSAFWDQKALINIYIHAKAWVSPDPQPSSKYHCQNIYQCRPPWPAMARNNQIRKSSRCSLFQNHYSHMPEGLETEQHQWDRVTSDHGGRTTGSDIYWDKNIIPAIQFNLIEILFNSIKLSCVHLISWPQFNSAQFCSSLLLSLFQIDSTQLSFIHLI